MELSPYIETIDLELEAIEKGGFEHFMLKEIFTSMQVKSVIACVVRLNAEEVGW